MTEPSEDAAAFERSLGASTPDVAAIARAPRLAVLDAFPGAIEWFDPGNGLLAIGSMRSIGGGGEQVTLKLVARYGDANNVGGGIENVRRKEAVLLQHCETVGRDPADIERTVGPGTVTIRDSRAEAERVVKTIFERNGGARAGSTLAGSPSDVAEAIAPFLEIGYRHLIADFPAPHDEESMTRPAAEVRPLLERS